MARIRPLVSAVLLGTALTSRPCSADQPVVQELTQPRAMPSEQQPSASAPQGTTPATNPPPPVHVGTDCAPAPDACAPACSAPVPCPPPTGPRIRIVVPPPQITFRKTRQAVTCQPSACETAPVSRPCSNQFGGAPQQPQQPSMTTINVPYTHYVPVQTYGVVPFSGVAAAPTTSFGAGFGAASNFGFGGAFGNGLVQTGGFGGVANVGFGGAGVNTNEAALRALLASMTKNQSKDAGFGAAPGEEGCKKELAELTAQVDKIRTELADFKKASETTNAKLAEAVLQIAQALKEHKTTLDQLDRKIGNGFENKSLTKTIAELSTQLEELKAKGPK
jgi:hypothetical protein